MLNIETYYPQHLRSIVKCFWRLSVPSLLGKPYEEAVIPDGHHEIIFHLQKGGGRRLNNTGWDEEPAAFIAGQTLKEYRVRLEAGSVIYGIRFLPHTIHPLIHLPLHELTGRILPLEVTRQLAPLVRCISENSRATFKSLEEELLRIIVQTQPANRSFLKVEAAVGLLMATKGSIQIDAVLTQVSLTGKHLDTLFQRYVGINPKKLANIIRLNHFIDYKAKNPSASLTNCSYEVDMYDQSHLIKLFRDFTGNAPKLYLKANNVISNQFARL